MNPAAKSTPNVLDVCCGSRMFYFDKKDTRVLFSDVRSEVYPLSDGRSIEVRPDLVQDFRKLDFKDESFSLVVFDPPHLNNLGKKSDMWKKYGGLDKKTWKTDLAAGFGECFRVLKPGGTLIFKWNEYKIELAEVLKLTDHKPLFGHKSGKNSKTHWVCFIK